ncbi:zinc finger CCCH-type with G patch domain-containing protein [Nilaparvata lugens]|uniref:zinc finger CCCH-type with G patch domain-containing protein n=1 Tax=Nilaparvata lugens TaxID=108931 RepID=UPI00193D9FB1|nr:zinc finger CCCH-type with G patch domain-containing protein [Nilaparvata lugens]
MENEERLKLTESLKQYELQLQQISSALGAVPESASSERESLLSLQNDIGELIALTKENLDGLAKPSTGHVEQIDAEYELFKAELSELEGSNSKDGNEQEPHSNTGTADIKEEMDELQGTKCQAPYKLHWQAEPSYHNALIMSVKKLSNASGIHEIMVRVLFVNPTHREMLPCPYFLEGQCRFTEDKCRFSHGQLVPLKDLSEYREPDFSVVRAGSRVLAKRDDSLWHHANVVEVLPRARCLIKFNSGSLGGRQLEVDLHNLLPLQGQDDQDSSSSGSSDDDEASDNNERIAAAKDQQYKAIVEATLMRTPPSGILGSWEKHTKGIGSRLMEKMGYIHGSGLGKNGEGITEPVEAVVMPAGKSLDHCMELRESAGGDKDMFKAERHRLKMQLRDEKRREKEYQRQKQKTDVFSFLNSTLAPGAQGTGERQDDAASTSKVVQPSGRRLNIERLQVDEQIKKAERDLGRLREALTRQTAGSTAHKLAAARVVAAESDLSRLHDSQQAIVSRQDRTKERHKMTVF